MAQKIKITIFGMCATLLLLAALALPPSLVQAACSTEDGGVPCGGNGTAAQNPGSTDTTTTPTTICDLPNLTADQQTSCTHCKNTTDNGALNDCLQHNVIITDINTIVGFLSAAVGIVVIGTIIVGGIQYSMAGGSPDAVGKAKQRMTNGAIAFLVFLFIFAFLQWIIPGGIFSNS